MSAAGTTPRITAARLHPWIDTKTIVDGAYAKRFGVQVQAGGMWLHLAVGGVAAIFDTAEAAQANADEVMRQVEADHG